MCTDIYFNVMIVISIMLDDAFNVLQRIQSVYRYCCCLMETYGNIFRPHGFYTVPGNILWVHVVRSLDLETKQIQSDIETCGNHVRHFSNQWPFQGQYGRVPPFLDSENPIDLSPILVLWIRCKSLWKRRQWRKHWIH